MSESIYFSVGFRLTFQIPTSNCANFRDVLVLTVSFSEFLTTPNTLFLSLATAPTFSTSMDESDWLEAAFLLFGLLCLNINKLHWQG